MKKPGKSSRQTAGLKTPRYSLLAGKIQGIVAGEGTRGPANAPIAQQFQRSTRKIPYAFRTRNSLPFYRE
jgi:hypothetical protein